MSGVVDVALLDVRAHDVGRGVAVSAARDLGALIDACLGCIASTGSGHGNGVLHHHSASVTALLEAVGPDPVAGLGLQGVEEVVAAVEADKATE
jgi:hypothetical protein